MLIKQVVHKTGLVKDTIISIKKNVLMNSCIGSDYSENDVSTLIMISYLMMARFDFIQIKTMLTSPGTIPQIVSQHADELNTDFTFLYGIMKRLDLSAIHNAHELSMKIKESLISAQDKEAIYYKLKQLCQELLSLLRRAKKAYNTVNVIDLPAMIPLVGIPFGIMRSIVLSKASQLMSKTEELSNMLSDNLLQFEINIDFAAIEQPNKYLGIMSNWATPNVSPGNYIKEVRSGIRTLNERVWSINEQLNRIKV